MILNHSFLVSVGDLRTLLRPYGDGERVVIAFDPQPVDRCRITAVEAKDGQLEWASGGNWPERKAP